MALVVAYALLGPGPAGGTRPVRAATPSALDIVAVRHDPRGEILASLRASEAASTIGQVSALVDGAPRPTTIVSRPATPASVVIAIDTSASMQGTPIANARQAAIALADRLNPNDAVSIVTFADQPHVVAPFSTDRATTDAQLQYLVAGGNTALYDTVAMAANLLDARPSGPRVLVLLTDGQDVGSTLANGRAASLDRIVASGAQVDSFALGTEADTSYLAEAAHETRGSFSAVAGDAALNALFVRLGEQLSAPVQVAVQVPPLTRGDHLLEIRAQVGGQMATATRDVSVTNDGMLTAEVRPSATGEDGMEVLDVTSAAPPDTLTLSAAAGGTTLPVLVQPARVLIDPWHFPAGALDVHVTASMSDTVVSTADFTVQVPALTPQLAIALPGTPGSTVNPAGAAATSGTAGTAQPRGDEAVITGRVQGAPDAVLVATIDGHEVARGPLPELRVPSPRGKQLVASIVDASGRSLASTSRALPPSPPAATAVTASAAPWQSPWTSLVASAMGALAVGMLGVRYGVGRRRRGRRRDWEPTARTLLVGRAVGSHAESRPLATLVVRPPDGSEHRYPVGRRPISLGRSSQCDVVIDDDAVSDVHARLIALGGGDFQVHGIAPRRRLPCDGGRADEWMVVRPGEQIAIGRYVLTLLEAEASVA